MKTYLGQWTISPPLLLIVILTVLITACCRGGSSCFCRAGHTAALLRHLHHRRTMCKASNVMGLLR